LPLVPFVSVSSSAFLPVTRPVPICLTFAAAPKTERGRIVVARSCPAPRHTDRPAPLSSPANGDIADEIRAQPADDAGRRATRFDLGAILASDGCLIGVGPASGLGENKHRRDRMLKLALFFFIVSIIAGVFGFTGISAAAAGIAKVLFFIFIITFVVLLVLGLVVGSAIF
jgi:uncharacterized membrane protein YtjA (UPF0391 family)